MRLEPVLGGRAGAAGSIALSPVFKTPGEVEAGSPLFLDMVEDARILYDPDEFLARRLARLRGRLQELSGRCIWRGNAWYWELKPDLQPGEVVTSQSLAQSYLVKAQKRLKALAFFATRTRTPTSCARPRSWSSWRSRGSSVWAA